MKSLTISLNTIDKVKNFVNTVAAFDGEFDLTSGRFVIDAKSIMGIFSLDLGKNLVLNVYDDNEYDTVKEKLKDFLV